VMVMGAALAAAVTWATEFLICAIAFAHFKKVKVTSPACLSAAHHCPIGHLVFNTSPACINTSARITVFIIISYQHHDMNPLPLPL